MPTREHGPDHCKRNAGRAIDNADSMTTFVGQNFYAFPIRIKAKNGAPIRLNPQTAGSDS